MKKGTKKNSEYAMISLLSLIISVLALGLSVWSTIYSAKNAREVAKIPFTIQNEMEREKLKNRIQSASIYVLALQQMFVAGQGYNHINVALNNIVGFQNDLSQIPEEVRTSHGLNLKMLFISLDEDSSSLRKLLIEKNPQFHHEKITLHIQRLVSTLNALIEEISSKHM